MSRNLPVVTFAELSSALGIGHTEKLGGPVMAMPHSAQSKVRAKARTVRIRARMDIAGRTDITLSNR